MKADSVIGFGFLVALFAASARAEDETPGKAVEPKVSASKTADGGARLREIIDEVRKAEERYRNLETTIRIVSQDEVNFADPNDKVNLSKSEETCYTLQQGERFLFKRREVQTYGPNEPSRTEQVVAFDGETTRSVVFDNCVNFLVGRYEPPRLYPPHTWSLRTQWVNYPLSVYLQGTDAIKKHPKSFKAPGQRGRVFEVAKVEVSYEGEETVDGLECVKLSSHHWCRETDRPQVVGLWLARDRNYLGVRTTTSVGEGPQGMIYNETKTTEWTELEPGLWLPKQIQMTHYMRPQNGGDPMVRSRATLFVDKVGTGGNQPPSRFRDMKIPNGLPTYKIDEEGFVEGSAVQSVKTRPGDPAELERIIAELKRQEDRYQRFEVTTTATYRTVGDHNLGASVVTSQVETERTVSLPGKLYSERVSTSRSSAGFVASAGPPGASQGASDHVSRNEEGWNGSWIRSLNSSTNTGAVPPTQTWASLRKGGPKGLNAFRPHTALFSDHRTHSRPLSDYLAARCWDETNKYYHLVEYIGEETVNGLDCAKLRLGMLFGDEKVPKHQFFFLWLARERNYLPVRSEWVELGRSDRIPTSDTHVDDLREIAPGLWFPYHVSEIAHDSWGGDGAGTGQVRISWRRDRQVENLNLDPDVLEELFAPAADAGTWVNVWNESGQPIGGFRQKNNGPPDIADEKFAVMAEIGRIDWRDQEDQKRRQAAQDALVGTPLPEFGEGKWLNDPAESHQSLAGKVLLIEFWAEWWQPSENDLQALAKANRDLIADGVTVISVHPAVSDKREIQDFSEETGFDCPIYVDVASQTDGSRWGRLFEKLAVRELPHAFVVDRQGKIAAHGPLDKMMAQARAKAAEKP